MTSNNCANCTCIEDMRTIHITNEHLNIYKDIDFYSYGVVFEEAFAFITHPELCLDLWGFGEDEEEAIRNLFKTTEEWNAVYKRKMIRFCFVDSEEEVDEKKGAGLIQPELGR